MILKALSRHDNNTKQLLSYLLRYTTTAREGNKRIAQKELICHNVRSRTLNGIIKEFEAFERTRPNKTKRSVTVYHYILSWSIKDSQTITDDMIRDMAYEFIRLRGDKIMYCGSIHRDKQAHVHLSASAPLDYSSPRISKARFAQIKHELTEYQREKYPELVNSLPEHGRKLRGLLQSPTHIPGRTELQKVQLVKTILGAQKQCSSLKQFIEELTAHNLIPYYRGEEQALTGIVFNGKKYRFRTLGVDLTAVKLQMEKKSLVQSRIRKVQSIREKTAVRDHELGRGSGLSPFSRHVTE